VCIYFSSPTYTAILLTFLGFITHTTYTGKYKTWFSSLCNFLPSPATSYPKVMNTFLAHVLPLIWQTKLHTCVKHQAQLQFYIS
jgi:hypothetical protein